MPGPSLRRLGSVISVVVACAACAVVVRAQAPADFSGRWVSVPERFSVLRNAPVMGNGWGGHVSGVRAISRYEVTVLQSGDMIDLTFPGGAGNFLTRRPFTIGRDAQVDVQNRGDWWAKRVSSARWDGSHLTLRAVSLSGWWKDEDPAAITSQPTQLETTFDLALDAQGARLSLTISVADEKGQAQYLQIFTRAE